MSTASRGGIGHKPRPLIVAAPHHSFLVLLSPSESAQSGRSRHHDRRQQNTKTPSLCVTRAHRHQHTRTQEKGLMECKSRGRHQQHRVSRVQQSIVALLAAVISWPRQTTSVRVWPSARITHNIATTALAAPFSSAAAVRDTCLAPRKESAHYDVTTIMTSL